MRVRESERESERERGREGGRERERERERERGERDNKELGEGRKGEREKLCMGCVKQNQASKSLSRQKIIKLRFLARVGLGKHVCAKLSGDQIK